MRGSREGNIVGGIMLILIDLYGISIGRLPLKGHFDTINVNQHPTLFWGYSIGLGLIGLGALLWGLTRPRKEGL
jgi:hypothetical protein